MMFDELARCRVWIEAALGRAGGTHTFDDVALGVLSGRFQMWPLDGGVIITEINDFPRKRHLNVFLAGGDLCQMTGRLPQIEAFMSAHKVDALTGMGRASWGRAMRRHGWVSDGIEAVHWVFRKDE